MFFNIIYKERQPKKKNTSTKIKTNCIKSTFFSFYEFAPTDRIGTFKTQRRDGDKNVAEKVNLRYFSLYSDYSYPLTLSIVGEPS